MDNDLKSHLFEQLPLIDGTLIQRSIELWKRPHDAAMMFVNVCIVEIEGATKENYLEQEWFAVIYRLVGEWYVNKYGEAVLSHQQPSSDGFVIIWGHPFRLSIPYIRSKVDPPGETAWMIFPRTIQPDEDVAKFIVDSPNLEHLPTEDRTALKADISQIAVQMRGIHLDLMTAEIMDSQVKQMARSIESHIAKFVRDICTLEESDRANALWELHLAVEKCFKVFIYQQTGQGMNSHSLEDLCDKAEQHGLSPLDRSFLNALPDKDRVLKYRYNEISPPDLEEVAGIYSNALVVMAHCAEALKRHFGLNEARILLRKPLFI